MEFSRHIVYIDILFFTNFIINYFLLFCTARLLKLDKQEGRLILSAALGGVYAVCMFFPQLNIFYTAIFKILFSVSMIILAFGFGGVRRFIRKLLSFYLICFVFGGGTFALYYFTDISRRLNIILNNGVVYMQLSLPMLLLFIALSFVLVNYVFWLFKNKAQKGNLYVEIEIFLNDKSCTTKAFLDTGNMLVNPVTQKSVVVCQLDSVQKLIPAEYRGFFDGDYNCGGISSDCDINITLLPYCSLGESDGVIPSFKADKIKCTIDKKTYELQGVFIAVSKAKLSTDGSYFALVNPTIIC